MDNGLRQIQELLFVNVPILPREIPGRRSNHGIFHKAVFQKINFRLGVTTYVHISVSARAALYGIQRVKHIGIHSVVIQAGIRHSLPDDLTHLVHLLYGLVLRCVDHLIINKFAVLQHPLALCVVLVVVHLHHSCLVLRADCVIVEEFGADKSLPLQLTIQLRVPLLQYLLLHQFRLEEIPAVLNVLHTRLPIEI